MTVNNVHLYVDYLHITAKFFRFLAIISFHRGSSKGWQVLIKTSYKIKSKTLGLLGVFLKAPFSIQKFIKNS